MPTGRMTDKEYYLPTARSLDVLRAMNVYKLNINVLLLYLYVIKPLN